MNPNQLCAVDVAPTMRAGGNETGGDRPYGTDVDTCDGLVAHTLNAKGGAGRMDFESETLVAHSLRGEGFDAGEDGTGRGTPLTVCFDETQITSAENRCNPLPGDPCHPIPAHGRAPTIAFSAKDYGGDALEDLSPTLRAGAFDKSHANAGVMPAVLTGWRVRRLTPLECERLQGFPEDYTAIEYRGKPAADGPRYKALGNSMAVNCMRWIGRRIEMVSRNSD